MKNNNQILVVPNCLIQNETSHLTIVAKNLNHSLVMVDDVGFKNFLNAKEKQTTACGGFFNVTDEFLNQSILAKPSVLKATTFLEKFNKDETVKNPFHEREIKQNVAVTLLLKQLNPTLMWKNLSVFSAFSDRFAGSDHGVKSAEWIKDQVLQMALYSGYKDVTIDLISTGFLFKQPSVVVKVGTSTEPGVVVSAHLDTMPRILHNKPGADDDGSGSVTVLETLRVILDSGLHFKKPIYFIWYAAEEMGLVGSKHVVDVFKNKNIQIDAVLHFDMTGYAPNNEKTMWLVTDYTCPNLTDFLRKLIDQYVKRPVSYTQCGYACSDHATWTKNGYAAGIAAEAAFKQSNPNMHTSRDTMEKLSLEHMFDYAKLALAFTLEIAEPY